MTVDKGNGKVRITTDFTKLNEQVISERHPIPKIKDIFVDMTGAKVFSKLDISKAYFQIPLDDDSKDCTTTITPLGLRRYNRLPMGLTDSASAFQRRIQQTLAGLPGVKVYIDDILVFGKDQAEHDRNLRVGLRRLEEDDFRLQMKKIILNVKSVPDFGHIISDEGIAPKKKEQNK